MTQTYNQNKEQVISNAKYSAESAMKQFLGLNHYNSGPAYALAKMQMETMMVGIEAAIRTVVYSVYTDEDFNRDIGLTR